MTQFDDSTMIASATQWVDRSVLKKSLRTSRRPEYGDLVLVEVTEVGWPDVVESTDDKCAWSLDGLYRNLQVEYCRLAIGMQVLGVIGNRYSLQQYVAESPDDDQNLELLLMLGFY